MCIFPTVFSRLYAPDVRVACYGSEVKEKYDASACRLLEPLIGAVYEYVGNVNEPFVSSMPPIRCLLLIRLTKVTVSKLTELAEKFTMRRSVLKAALASSGMSTLQIRTIRPCHSTLQAVSYQVHPVQCHTADRDITSTFSGAVHNVEGNKSGYRVVNGCLLSAAVKGESVIIEDK